MVVVGSSVAGVRAARGLRREKFAGRIILLGEEDDAPYDKPALSKQYLGGSFDAERIRLLPDDVADAEGIEVHLGVPAIGLDVVARTVKMADGSKLSYDRCVVATGASARPSPWGAVAGVHVLRSRRDSDALRAALNNGPAVVIVGGGFIGAEVAAGAAAKGCRVTLVDPLELPAARLVGDEVAALLAGVHARHKVEAHFGKGVASLEGGPGALEVTLTDGSRLHAEVAVVGIGAVPNDGWLVASGIPVDNGVVCDEYCRAVDVPDVFAAGDVARWLHLGHGVSTRVEHWTNAVEQAAHVAYNIMHPDQMRAYKPVEYVWSDQYDWKIQIVGRPHGAVAQQLVGETAGERPRWVALYRDHGDRLVGGVSVNWPRASVECRRLMAVDSDQPSAVRAVEALARTTQ